MIVIGLSGKARHGKGSIVQLSQILMQTGDEEREVRQVSFATALKETAREVVTLMGLDARPAPAGWTMSEAGMTYAEEETFFYLTKKGLPAPVAVQLIEIARGLTLEQLKLKTPQARRFLQFLGTEAFRKNVDDLYWVKRAAAKIEAMPEGTKLVFIPDMRFPNEADYIREIGGQVWRIERYNADGTPFDNGLSAEAKAHPSETALDGYKPDVVIGASNMEQLFTAVKARLDKTGLVAN